MFTLKLKLWILSNSESSCCCGFISVILPDSPSRPQVRRRLEAEQLSVSGGGRRLQRLDSTQRETEAAAPAGAQPGRRGGRGGRGGTDKQNCKDRPGLGHVCQPAAETRASRQEQDGDRDGDGEEEGARGGGN